MTLRPSPLLPCLAFFLLIRTSPAAETGSEREKEEPLSWEAIIAESDGLHRFSEDPLAEVLPPPSPWTFSTSLAAGHGYSDNFLKTLSASASSFLRLSGDLYLTRLDEAGSFTALLFGEYHRYLQAGRGADEETILFGLLTWEWFTASGGIHGIEADIFFGDQIFDAALLDLQEPTGGSFRQLRPGVRAFTEWPIGQKDVLRWELGLRRTWYGDSLENYTRPEIRLEWVRTATPKLEFTSAVEAAVEHYDHRLAREANGLLPVGSETLRLKVLSLEQELDWDRFPLRFTDLRGKAGLRFESDRTGHYDGNRTLWASLSLHFRIGAAELDLRARWQNRVYSDRQVGFLDDRALRQIFRGIELELTVPLYRRWDLHLQAESSEFSSRDTSSNYSENRVYGALRWTW